jgi:hypothetical protein
VRDARLMKLIAGKLEPSGVSKTGCHKPCLCQLEGSCRRVRNLWWGVGLMCDLDYLSMCVQ